MGSLDEVDRLHDLTERILAELLMPVYLPSPHWDEKAWGCRYCGKSFYKIRAAAEHQQLHERYHI